MQDDTRRAVAYIAARLASGAAASSVFDSTSGRHSNFGGDVSPEQVSVFDYDAGCNIGGSPSSLFHYGHGSNLSLEMNGTDFSGFDYGTGSNFSGTVSGGSVSVFDYEHGSHFNYSVS